MGLRPVVQQGQGVTAWAMLVHEQSRSGDDLRRAGPVEGQRSMPVFFRREHQSRRNLADRRVIPPRARLTD